MIEIEQDEQGTWEVHKGERCSIKLLVEPSQEFIDEHQPVPPTPEELQAEADDARLKEIAAMGQSAIKVPVLAEGFKLLCKKLGFG